MLRVISVRSVRLQTDHSGPAKTRTLRTGERCVIDRLGADNRTAARFSARLPCSDRCSTFRGDRSLEPCTGRTDARISGRRPSVTSTCVEPTPLAAALQDNEAWRFASSSSSFCPMKRGPSHRWRARWGCRAGTSKTICATHFALRLPPATRSKSCRHAARPADSSSEPIGWPSQAGAPHARARGCSSQ
jgi:hypothetical protein